MKLIITLLMITLTTSSFAAEKFGTGAQMDKLIPISKLLASPQDYDNKLVTVSGTIVSVCKKRGCWMKFASDKRYQDLKIKVKDGVMVFPLTLRGKTGHATGKLQTITLSEKRARSYFAHIAKEQGKNFDPKSVKGPQNIYQLVPVGVTVD